MTYLSDVESSIPPDTTLPAYRAARVRHEHHTFLRGIVARVHNR